MNKIVRDKWLEALRSDDYLQARGALHIKQGGVDSFCCLGVLCSISPELKREENGSPYVWYGDGERGSSNKLPDDFREELGITQLEQNSLIQLNDDDVLPFAEIADWISSNL